MFLASRIFSPAAGSCATWLSGLWKFENGLGALMFETLGLIGIGFIDYGLVRSHIWILVYSSKAPCFPVVNPILGATGNN